MDRRLGVPQGRGSPIARALGAYAVVELVVVACAVVLSVVVAIDGDPLPGDLPIAHRVQDLPAFHSIARAFRWGMGTEGVLVMGAAIAGALWLWRRRWDAAVLLPALLVLRIVQPLLKHVVDRQRPSEDLIDRRSGFNSESFPSGHMMSAVVLCGMLAVIASRLPLRPWPRRALIAGLVAVVVLNGTSSVYMGVHWPSDVLGGVLWGLVIAIPAGMVIRMRPRESD